MKRATAPVEPTQLVRLTLEQLQNNPRNPRNHPAEQIERLMASLARDGQTRPLLVRRENKMLIAGHGVLAAMKRLGWVEAAVLLWNVDQADADRYMLADNRTSDLSTHDDRMVAQLLRDIDAADFLATGFSDTEATKLFAPLEQRELPVHEIETADVHDEFWIAVRGPMVDQAEVLQRIKQLLSEFGAVDIEVGTSLEAG